MKIILNNREEIIESEGISITELLTYKQFTWKMLVIKVNGKIIKRNEYDTLHVKEGDDVSIIHLITGG